MRLTRKHIDRIIASIIYETHPGYHTFSTAKCGHLSRRTHDCAQCMDKHLMEHGIDITQRYSPVKFERIDGRLIRKVKGQEVTR